MTIGKGKGVKLIHQNKEIKISLVKRRLIGIEAPPEVTIIPEVKAIKESNRKANCTRHDYMHECEEDNKKKKV